jgi:hypothetical protein
MMPGTNDGVYMTETNKIIEINGVKFEVDGRTATLRQIDTIRIGARVKVLKKKYGDDYEVHHGVVVGFEPFKEAPTFIIAYIETTTALRLPSNSFTSTASRKSTLSYLIKTTRNR